LDREALRAALDRIVVRHEVLRTRFEQPEGMAVQVIDPTGSFALQEWDLRAQPQAEKRLQELAAAEAHAPFDLVSGPLLRGQLICLDESEHVLLVSMHHIVSDGWSLGIFLKELGALYRAFSQGQPDPLPPLSLQYADYAHWQRQWVSGERLQSQLQYWKQQLAGAPPVLELPVDRARPAVASYAGARVEVCLEASLARQLRELSRAHGVTLYMTLLGSWAVLLARLSGQKDVVIGTPVANRNRVELEGLIGFFVNTLALRIDLSAGGSVSELLEQVKGVVLQAHAHQDIPFEQVVDALSPVRSLAHGPLFQVMFSWQNTLPEELELPGLRLQGLTLPGTTASFDLTLALQESGEEIRGALEYATALFDGETVERYLGCWKRLLQGMLAFGTMSDPQQRLEQLTMLDEQERWQLVEGWNATAMPDARERCLQELFEAQVERDPGATAIVHQGQRLSYSELNGRANRLAHHLRALGVRPDMLVGVCAERSLELMVGVLGIVKAGGAYVPLDPTYPQDRLAYMLEDCGATLVVTQEKRRQQLSELAPAGVRLLSLDNPTGQIDVAVEQTEAAGQELLRLAGPDHLAYVIYTSGSTGRPKGAGVYRRGLNNLLQWYLQCIELSAADRVLVVTSASFDLTQKNLLGPLLQGASVHLGAELFEPAGLVATIRDAQITVMNLTPSAFYAIVEADTGGALSSLKYVMLGGEPIDAVRMAQLQARYPQLQVINSYGPTECADVCAFHLLTERNLRDRLIPLGKPVPHTRLYVLDERRQPVPIGVAGEIYVGGVGVGAGYLNQPTLTAERFVCDPFDRGPQARMYRTGDVGRWLPGGVIEFLGRNDQQVKVRGYRIELGEIEARLREHAGVREAVVIAREDTPGDQRLVAYLTAADEPPTVESLRALARAALPEHMVPSAFVVLSSLPLTPSGKLDRRALPAPETEAYGLRAYEPPCGQIETAVADIWRELLKVERVGRDDDFFDLGGHSLLATQLTSRLRHVFEVDLPIMEVFRSPTLAKLAESIYSAQLKEFDPEEVQRLSADIDGLTEADLQSLLERESRAADAGVEVQ
jgi:amino acid adenylation domain-containing protein